MECTGKIQSISRNWQNDRLQITFEVNEQSVIQDVEKLKDCEKLTIKAVQFRKKRSLDANSYYWVLLGKLAKVLRISNQEAHNMMLCKVSLPEIFEEKAVYMTIPDTEEAEKKVRNAMDYHLRPTSQVREGLDGVMYRTYMLLRGSHTFNTEEMSQLISELIVCCKEAGITDSEIASPEEKRILKERYGVDIG